LLGIEPDPDPAPESKNAPAQQPRSSGLLDQGNTKHDARAMAALREATLREAALREAALREATLREAALREKASEL
jgi:uncharacterized protein YjbI with pentapeptide repeats